MSLQVLWKQTVVQSEEYKKFTVLLLEKIKGGEADSTKKVSDSDADLTPLKKMEEKVGSGRESLRLQCRSDSLTQPSTELRTKITC